MTTLNLSISQHFIYISAFQDNTWLPYVRFAD